MIGRARIAARILLTLAVAACAFGVGAQGASAAMKKGFFGETTHDGASVFPVYRDLGVQYFQTQLRWERVAASGPPANPTDPNDPAYAWPRDLDQTIQEAAATGIRVAIMPTGSPAWANGGHPEFGWAPLNPQDYANFVVAASRRYPSVRHWMIWGEPTRGDSFMPTVGQTNESATRLTPAQAETPRRYARLLDAAYVALKGESRSNRVIGGMSYTLGQIKALNWIKYLRLPNGRPPRMDLYGHNPFPYRLPKLRQRPSPDGRVDVGDLPRLLDAIDRYLKPRGTKLRLWLSEFTIATARDVAFQDNFVSPETAAKWTSAALRVSRQLRRVEMFSWFRLYDQPERSDGALVSHLGLLFADGTPKPGYAAFKNG
ncbi:MAG TPA: hypothetical protein VK279_09340 [Solirubrobacteraceae bacterium]|nr:hypothetical protein [Solirubrobacteraceae bacterium]